MPIMGNGFARLVSLANPFKDIDNLILDLK